MAKVRIKSPQWAGFSSYLGPTKFENGISVDDVTEMEATRLGSIMAIEFIDDKGKPVSNAGFGQIQVDGRNKPAPVEKKKLMAAEKFDPKAEINADPVKVVLKNKKSGEDEEIEKDLENEVADLEKGESSGENETAEPQQELPVYSREQLEEIADQKGIAGLRSIGNLRGVKSNSVESLITKILKAQG